MALKDIWVNKVNGVDDVDANDINTVAQATIALENQMGGVETALDEIIAIQEALIGGNA